MKEIQQPIEQNAKTNTEKYKKLSNAFRITAALVAFTALNAACAKSYSEEDVRRIANDAANNAVDKYRNQHQEQSYAATQPAYQQPYQQPYQPAYPANPNYPTQPEVIANWPKSQQEAASRFGVDWFTSNWQNWRQVEGNAWACVDSANQNHPFNVQGFADGSVIDYNSERAVAALNAGIINLHGATMRPIADQQSALNALNQINANLSSRGLPSAQRIGF